MKVHIESLSKPNKFLKKRYISSHCHVDVRDKRNLVSLPSFLKIMDIETKILCKYCMKKAKEEFELDPEHPQYGLILLELYDRKN